MKKIVSLVVIIALLCTTTLNCFAETNSTGKGFYHDDGSYQYGEEELARLNLFIAKNRNTKNSISYADFYQFTAPDYYKQFDNEVKEMLEAKAWSCSTEATVIVPEYELNYTYWDASIKKYGNSLKGEAWITNRASESVLAECYVHVAGNYDSHVGYSSNIKYDTTLKTTVKATVVTDPASGTYQTTGVFSYIVYDTLGNPKLDGRNARSSKISYVNPNE